MLPMYRFYCIETLDDLANIKKNIMKAEIDLFDYQIVYKQYESTIF